jgi:hypothetical protein
MPRDHFSPLLARLLGSATQRNALGSAVTVRERSSRGWALTWSRSNPVAPHAKLAPASRFRGLDRVLRPIFVVSGGGSMGWTHARRKHELDSAGRPSVDVETRNCPLHVWRGLMHTHTHVLLVNRPTVQPVVQSCLAICKWISRLVHKTRTLRMQPESPIHRRF